MCTMVFLINLRHCIIITIYLSTYSPVLMWPWLWRYHQWLFCLTLWSSKDSSDHFATKLQAPSWYVHAPLTAVLCTPHRDYSVQYVMLQRALSELKYTCFLVVSQTIRILRARIGGLCQEKGGQVLSPSFPSAHTKYTQAKYVWPARLAFQVAYIGIV